MRTVFSLSIFIIVAYACALAPNQVQAGSGFYLSSEIGGNFASGVNTTGTSNDRSSVCDEFINPSYRDVESTEGFKDFNCTGPNRGVGDTWHNEFDRGSGIMAGAAVGYSFSGQYPDQPLGGFRVELEYLYRDSKYDQNPDVQFRGTDVNAQKFRDELEKATDRIGSITSHNLFANLFYDFINTSRFTPYVGVGTGVGFTDMEYGSVWARRSDTEQIFTGEIDVPNAENPRLGNYGEIRRNLAGTASVAQTTLSDTLFGFQVLFGVDYAFTEAMSLGLKGRWVRFESFEDDRGAVWDPLRGHKPNLRIDGTEPVSGGIETDDIEFFGVSLNVKYHF